MLQKSPEIHANQSNLLIGVVTVFKYGKRFRFAPLFNECLISDGLDGVNYVNFNSNLLYIPGNKVVVALAVTLMTSGPLSMSSG